MVVGLTSHGTILRNQKRSVLLPGVFFALQDTESCQGERVGPHRTRVKPGRNGGPQPGSVKRITNEFVDPMRATILFSRRRSIPSRGIAFRPRVGVCPERQRLPSLRSSGDPIESLNTLPLSGVPQVPSNGILVERSRLASHRGRPVPRSR